MTNFKFAVLQVSPAAMERLPALLERYAVDVSGGVVIDGEPIAAPSALEQSVSATLFVDDTARTRFRLASLDGVSIAPLPILDGESITGYRVPCCYPAELLSDIQRDPQPELELFEGIQIL